MHLFSLKTYIAYRAIFSHNKFEYRDGIHLSTDGSKIVTKEILKVIRESEWEPSLYWASMAPEFPEDSPYYRVGPDGKTTINISHVISQWKLEWLDDKEREALNSNSVV